MTSTSVSGGTSKYNANPGPKRTIARRGAEVFVAVGKEIRWADLVYVKELYEVKLDRKARGRRAEDSSDDGSSSDDAAEGYRVRAPGLHKPSVTNNCTLDYQNHSCRRN